MPRRWPHPRRPAAPSQVVFTLHAGQRWVERQGPRLAGQPSLLAAWAHATPLGQVRHWWGWAVGDIVLVAAQHRQWVVVSVWTRTMWERWARPTPARRPSAETGGESPWDQRPHRG